MEEVLTEVDDDGFDDRLLFCDSGPCQEREAERARLERAVIEKAKAYGRAAQAVEDHMKKATEAGSDPRDGWQELRDLESTWEEMLLEAIKPLLEFESNQLQVKK